VGIVFAEYLKQNFPGKKLSLRIAQAIFLMAIYFTLARGGWLALIVMTGLYLLLFSRSASARLLTKAAVGGAIFLSAVAFGMDDFLQMDDYGTFQYRYDLILNAWEVIKQNPLLGSAFYSQNEALEASRQGQGIIDIVNAYLQVALSAGMVGLTLFVLLMALPIIMLRRLAKKLDAERLEAERDICNLSVVVLSGLGLMLGTISLVGVLPQYLYLFVGIAAGTVRVAAGALTASRREWGEGQ
jgi:O-antigen ligase